MTNPTGRNQFNFGWSKEEEEYLREKYQKLNNCELVKNLPKRTVVSVKSKLMDMGLHRSKELLSKLRYQILGGKNHPLYGTTRSDYVKERVRQANTGRKKTEKQLAWLKEWRKTQVLPKKDTSIEVKIQNFLKQLGIDFFTHQYIHIEHGYQCDILIPTQYGVCKKIVIECDGNYWHNYPKGTEVDILRTNEIIENGCDILRLWESEIRKMEFREFCLLLKNSLLKQIKK